MKKIPFLTTFLIMIFTTTALAANWEYVTTSSDGSDYYIDTKSARKIYKQVVNPNYMQRKYNPVTFSYYYDRNLFVDVFDSFCAYFRVVYSKQRYDKQVAYARENLYPLPKTIWKIAHDIQLLYFTIFACISFVMSRHCSKISV